MQIQSMRGVKWALHDKKNSFFSPKMPLIHLPIYKQIFFSGSSDEKKIFSLWGFKPAHGTKKIFFCRMTPKKKLAYILVNGLMANFEFRSFWAKKVDFFCHGAHILPLYVPIFGYFSLLT